MSSNLASESEESDVVSKGIQWILTENHLELELY